MRRIQVLQFLAGIALAVVAVIGCGAKDDSSAASNSASGAVASPAPMATGAPATTAIQLASTLTPSSVQPKKIIYKAEATLDCENLDKASQKLLAKVKSFGGYVGDASSTGIRGTVREATWTVRVPAERYGDLLKALPGIGELESSSQRAEDVSEEFYDAQARIKNKNVEEARLVDLLKNHSGKLSDVLVLEKELSRVREEIERIEGRIRYLANQTDLSTVTVTIREVKDFIPQGSPTLGTRTTRAWQGSIASLQETGASFLVLAVAAAPWLVPLLIIIWLIWRAANRKAKPLRRIVIPENQR